MNTVINVNGVVYTEIHSQEVVVALVRETWLCGEDWLTRDGSRTEEGASIHPSQGDVGI